MSANLNDRNATIISDMAYIADKLGQLSDVDKNNNVRQVFFDDSGNIRAEIKADKDLNAFAEKIQKNPAKYSDLLDNTKLVGIANDTTTGYKGIALQDLSDKSVTIGNAGTEGWSDVINDGQMAVGKIPDQLESANRFVNELKEIKINNENVISSGITLNLTGYSFGGSISQLMTTSLFASNNIGAVKTFEAYGTEGIVNNNARLQMLYNANKSGIEGCISNFVNDFDPIATVGVQIGNTIKISDIEKVWNILPTDPATGQKALAGIVEGIAYWHPLDSCSNVLYDQNGNIIPGSWEPFASTNAVNMGIALTSLLQDKMYVWMNDIGLNSIMSSKTPYSSAQAVFTPRPRVDPIAIDMDGDGVETLSQADGAYFDLDKNGFAEKTGWVKGDDALLVRDLNGDGKINDGGELFGDQTRLKDGRKAANGFEALAELDSNKDGKITAEDTEFSSLKVWQDKNGDRINQAA